jgi:hypothetical protein
MNNFDGEAFKDSLIEMSKATSAVVEEIERWYNYLRRIEELDRTISLEEKKRSANASGLDFNKDGVKYAQSLATTYNTLN